MTGGEALEALARACDVQTAFLDVDGRRRRASPESVVAVLRALGAPIDRVADAPAALAAEHEERAHALLDPVVLASPGSPATIPLRAHDQRIAGAASIEVSLESGELLDWSAPMLGQPNRIVLPEPLPLGAHDVTVAIGIRRATSTLLVAPERSVASMEEASWGVFAPLSALQRAEGAAPVYGDLDRLARWAGDQGATTVGTLPLLAAFLDEPAEISPYAPASRRLWNEVFIDLRRVPEVDAAGAAVEAAAAGTLVDLPALMAAKRPVLEQAVRRLFDRPGARLAQLRRFLDHRPDVRAYARFRAAREGPGADWRAWPVSWRRGGIPDGAVDEHVCRYHEFVQWVADAQLATATDAMRARGQQLYLDFPVGTHPLGFDVWSEPDAFAAGVTVGAPPDTFFAGGQNWGFPPLHPRATRPGGHAYLRACLRHHFRHAGVLRIDHVMGLHRLYWVPEGAPATDGVYVRYPAPELYAALLLEAARSGSGIVGEDLGTVPEEVERELGRRAIAGMHVLEFELDASRPEVLRPPPPGSLATIDTHDTPTFAAFWRDAEPALRTALCDALVERGHLASTASDDAGAVLAALLAELGESDAALVMVALEDLWLETEPQNVPGTTTEHPNWRRRAAHRLDELLFLDEVGRRLDRLDASRRRSAGRTAARC
jgi:4-alpha-glucanotransferase